METLHDQQLSPSDIEKNDSNQNNQTNQIQTKTLQYEHQGSSRCLRFL